MKRLLLGLVALCLLVLSLTGIVLTLRSQRQAQVLQQFIADGPANLAREEAAARQAGIRLTAQQLQQPLPPASQNAAPLYAKLTKLLHDRPLNLPVYAEGMDAFHTYTPQQIAAVRRTLAARQDVITLIHQAADRPKCVFVRDWSQGIALKFPEYQHQRELARLLKTESYLLARDGHYQEAVANQSLGFRLADHAAADHTLISYLVGVACEAVALSGMQSLLAQAGPDAVVDADVKSRVAAAYAPLSLRSAMAGDVGLGCASLEKTHKYEKYGVDEALFIAFPDEESPPIHNLPNKQVSAAEQARGHNLIDAWQADYLSEMLPLVRASDNSRAVRRSVFALAEQQASRKPPTPADPAASRHWVPRLLIPVISDLDQSDSRIRACESVTLAAAAILGEKAKTGAFADALPPGFTDAFTGKPLLYRREGSGFVVYSAGPTGHFDGGRPGVKAPGRESLFRYPAVPLP